MPSSLRRSRTSICVRVQHDRELPIGKSLPLGSAQQFRREIVPTSHGTNQFFGLDNLGEVIEKPRIDARQFVNPRSASCRS